MLIIKLILILITMAIRVENLSLGEHKWPVRHLEFTQLEALI